MCNIVDLDKSKEITVFVTKESENSFFQSEYDTLPIWVEVDKDDIVIPGEIELALSKILDITKLVEYKVLGRYVQSIT